MPDGIVCEDLFLVQARDVGMALSEWSEVWQKHIMIALVFTLLPFLLHIALLTSISR
jgi:hypothetical protein